MGVRYSVFIGGVRQNDTPLTKAEAQAWKDDLERAGYEYVTIK